MTDETRTANSKADLLKILIHVLMKRITLAFRLGRAISIQAEGKKLLEKHAVAPSAARLC